VDLPLSSFCRIEKSVVPSAADHDLAIEYRRARVDVTEVMHDLFESMGLVVAATG
jgi:hypothetical protein